MIELPEATVIASQIAAELTGKRIAAGDCGTAEHKWAFTNRPAAEYPKILESRTVAGAWAQGGSIVVSLDEDWRLVLGGGGERILFHDDAGDLPKKRHLTLLFEGGSALSMAVQGWGARFLFTADEMAAHPWAARTDPSPLDRGFTAKHFDAAFAGLAEGAKLHLKKLLITEPGVPGLGNGYLQDILFHAGIHSKRRAVDVSGAERRALRAAIVKVMKDATRAGGRDTETDLFGQVGGYSCLLDTRTKGTPCTACGTAIEKISFLGGSCYFCPTCQS